MTYIIDRLFQYLWFAIIIASLILGLRLMGEADENLHGVPPEHQPSSSNVR